MICFTTFSSSALALLLELVLAVVVAGMVPVTDADSPTAPDAPEIRTMVPETLKPPDSVTAPVSDDTTTTAPDAASCAATDPATAPSSTPPPGAGTWQSPAVEVATQRRAGPPSRAQ